MIYSLLAFVKEFFFSAYWVFANVYILKTLKKIFHQSFFAKFIWRILVLIRFFCLRRNKASISFHLSEMHWNRKMSSIETWSDIIFCPLNEYHATRLSLSGTSLYWSKMARMRWIKFQCLFTTRPRFTYQTICKSKYFDYLSISNVAN